MANKKFSEFTLKTDSANVDFVVGYDGTDNVRIAPSNLGGGGASDLNGLSDAKTTSDSLYVGTLPTGASGGGAGNTTLGKNAGVDLNTGSDNVIIGNFASGQAVNSTRSVAIGQYASFLPTNSYQYIIGIGWAASYNASDNYVIGIGDSTFFSGSGGLGSIAVGSNSLRSCTAAGTVAIGFEAGYSNTSGLSNTNLGYQAGYSNSTNGSRTMVGHQAGAYQTGASCTGIGKSALRQGTGFNNTAVGHNAMAGNISSGGFNTAVGQNALSRSGAKSGNIAVGGDAGRLLQTGGYNTLLGYQSGDSLTTGSNNIVIGYQAAASAVGVSNEITLGDASISALRCQVQTISALSDSRDKTNIQPSTYGLDLISQLNPVTFDWNMRDGAKVGQKDLGFIAQELQELDDENLQLVYDNNPDRLEASYGRLIPVLVQAIKELKAEVELLKA